MTYMFKKLSRISERIQTRINWIEIGDRIKLFFLFCVLIKLKISIIIIKFKKSI